MPDMPRHVERKKTVHEWTIGKDTDEYSTRRTLEDGIHFAKMAMNDMGIETDWDDAYRWRAGEGGSIILYVEVEEE